MGHIFFVVTTGLTQAMAIYLAVLFYQPGKKIA